MTHLVKQKLPRQFKMKRQMGGIHHPSPNFIGSIKQNRHSDWVTDPNQSNGKRQIYTKQNSQSCRHNHLTWQWNKSHKQANSKSSRCRTAIQTPQIRVIQDITKYAQGFLAFNCLVVRQITFDNLSRHSGSFLS